MNLEKLKKNKDWIFLITLLCIGVLIISLSFYYGNSEVLEEKLYEITTCKGSIFF